MNGTLYILSAALVRAVSATPVVAQETGKPARAAAAARTYTVNGAWTARGSSGL